LDVADRFCKQDGKKKRDNEVDTWQVGQKFLSPNDILVSFLLEKKDLGEMTCVANDLGHLTYEARGRG
jgi:hypothetical protein